MPLDDFIACDFAFIACDACDIAFVPRMRACDGNLKKMRLSGCLKTVGNFSGGTENLADLFLHDICERILFPRCFFLFTQKRNEKRDSFTARCVSSSLSIPATFDHPLPQLKESQKKNIRLLQKIITLPYRPGDKNHRGIRTRH